MITKVEMIVDSESRLFRVGVSVDGDHRVLTGANLIDIDGESEIETMTRGFRDASWYATAIYLEKVKALKEPN